MKSLSTVFCFCLLFSSFECAAEVIQLNSNFTTKPVIYQVFTRLYGNKNVNNKPWGTKQENGIGTFADINDVALEDMRNLGVTHVWYTGVLHHALVGNYSAIGIESDDPDVVKGRAGSPYAVKDYYNVNPDLAVNPAQRLAEFEALIVRTHKKGMKVIVDIVPNHVARRYHSVSNPKGVVDFGAQDNTGVEYHRDNNFYYVVGQKFQVPNTPGYKPLNGEKNKLSDGFFEETPAKWTGNGSRKAQPAADDWYETVKVNYGVRPDGSKDFPLIPENYRFKTTHEHFLFWRDKDVPNSWLKFRQIAEYWLEKGVDGFRFDMAEMVPVEFWSYMNSAIKEKNPQAFVMAEVYTPSEYRNYIQLGRMDSLYDKVGLYDSLKNIIQGKAGTNVITTHLASVQDIDINMLHFLENHDEQRIASPQFAGAAERALPAMVVSSLVGRSPTMLYFGQEVGESGSGDAGFGKASRTTIFDYWGVPAHQRWMNGGKFDGAKSTLFEQSLRSYYAELLTLSKHPAFTGPVYPLQSIKTPNSNSTDSIFAVARGDAQLGRMIVVSNFSALSDYAGDIQLPAELLNSWGKIDTQQMLQKYFPLKTNLLRVDQDLSSLRVENGEGKLAVKLPPLASVVFYLP